MITELRGAFHRDHDVQHKVLSLAIGDELRLEPEPTNPYDSNAIKVYASTDFIGYIAREDCLAVHALLPATATVHTVAGLKSQIEVKPC